MKDVQVLVQEPVQVGRLTTDFYVVFLFLCLIGAIKKCQYIVETSYNSAADYHPLQAHACSHIFVNITHF